MGMFKGFAKNKVEEERKRQEELERELEAQRLETAPNLEVIEPPEPEELQLVEEQPVEQQGLMARRGM